MLRIIRIILIMTTLVCFVAPVLAGQEEDLAKEMLRLTDMQKLMDQMVNQLQRMQADQIKSLQVPEKHQEKVLQFQNKLTRKIFDHMSWDKMEPEYIKLFSTVYTVEELKGIVDFYKSPAGQSMLKKQPMVMQRVMEIARSRMHGLVPELQKMAEEFAESVKDAR